MQALDPVVRRGARARAPNRRRAHRLRRPDALAHRVQAAAARADVCPQLARVEHDKRPRRAARDRPPCTRTSRIGATTRLETMAVCAGAHDAAGLERWTARSTVLTCGQCRLDLSRRDVDRAPGLSDRPRARAGWPPSCTTMISFTSTSRYGFRPRARRARRCGIDALDSGRNALGLSVENGRGRTQDVAGPAPCRRSYRSRMMRWLSRACSTAAAATAWRARADSSRRCAESSSTLHGGSRVSCSARARAQRGGRRVPVRDLGAARRKGPAHLAADHPGRGAIGRSSCHRTDSRPAPPICGSHAARAWRRPASASSIAADGAPQFGSGGFGFRHQCDQRRLIGVAERRRLLNRKFAVDGRAHQLIQLGPKQWPRRRRPECRVAERRRDAPPARARRLRDGAGLAPPSRARESSSAAAVDADAVGGRFPRSQRRRPYVCGDGERPAPAAASSRPTGAMTRPLVAADTSARARPPSNRSCSTPSAP